MTELSLLIAFVAGVVSFASPCCLPLVPAYVGYMVGSDPAIATRRRDALVEALFFVAGFSVVFISLWASVGLIGYALRDQAWVLRQVGGAALVFMGLHVAGVINIGALYREFHLPLGRLQPAGMGFGEQHTGAPSHGRSAMLGVVFAAGWTPCIGPILGGIIGLASVSTSVLEGTTLLVAYAAGLGVPFVLMAVGATSISQRLSFLRRHQRAVSRVTGAMLILVGFLMITNTFVRLSSLIPAAL
ncbi:MAG TPA: cytochrome c biogenesis protein CcdA [Candidatus Limnocylindrales bacterium]|nr:cytochrome c biogenesis protein CcdA [Candidatus Limnocylindrales bacterium]